MILLVENGAISRMGFAKILRGHNYEIIEHGNGAEAIDLLKESHRETNSLPRYGLAQGPLLILCEIVKPVAAIKSITLSGYLCGRARPQIDILQKRFKPPRSSHW